MKTQGSPLIRTLLALVVTGVLAAALIWAFRPAPVLVSAEQVSARALRIVVDEEGRTQVRDRYEVSAPVSGQLVRLAIEPGDAVRRGEPLFVIEPQYAAPLDARVRAQAQASLAAAEAALSGAQAQTEAAQARVQLADGELARLEPLAGSGHLPALALDRARAESRQAGAALRSARFAVDVARHQRDSARATLSVSGGTAAPSPITVVSPVDATVLRRLRRSEGAIQPGEPVLVLGDLDSLEVEVDLLSHDAVRVQPGGRVEIERWGGDSLLTGRVRRIEPYGFTRVSALGVEEQRVRVHVGIEDARDRWHRLGDGFRVDARFVLAENASVLQAPAAALFRLGDRSGAFVVADGHARLRQVSTGRRAGLSVEILDGLQAGDIVILHPGSTIADGTRVSIRRSDAR